MYLIPAHGTRAHRGGTTRTRAHLGYPRRRRVGYARIHRDTCSVGRDTLAYTPTSAAVAVAVLVLLFQRPTNLPFPPRVRARSPQQAAEPHRRESPRTDEHRSCLGHVCACVGGSAPGADRVEHRPTVPGNGPRAKAHEAMAARRLACATARDDDARLKWDTRLRKAHAASTRGVAHGRGARLAPGLP